MLEKYSPKDLQLIETAFQNIYAQFQRIEKWELKSGDALSDAERIEQEQASSIAKSHSFLNRVRDSYHKRVDKVKHKFQNAKVKTKWALSKREEFMELDKNITTLIQRLEGQFPDLFQDDLRTACEDLKDTSCRITLAQLIRLTEQDKPLTQALRFQYQCLHPAIQSIKSQGVNRKGDSYTSTALGSHASGRNNNGTQSRHNSYAPSMDKGYASVSVHGVKNDKNYNCSPISDDESESSSENDPESSSDDEGESHQLTRMRWAPARQQKVHVSTGGRNIGSRTQRPHGLSSITSCR